MCPQLHIFRAFSGTQALALNIQSLPERLKATFYILIKMSVAHKHFELDMTSDLQHFLL